MKMTNDVWLNEWKAEKVELLITPKDQNNMPLLGADVIKKLGLRLTQQKRSNTAGQKTISNLSEREDLKTKIRREFPTLFSRQGKIKNHIVRTKFKRPLRPIQQKGRRIPLALQAKVSTEISRLTKQGHIVKLKSCNEDQFISPIVITVKKDGSLKLALDSKKLNEWVIKNKYQMTNIEEHVDQVAQIVTSEKPGQAWFSSADLDYAYGQLDLSEETAKQCNFSIVGGEATGTYQFRTGFYGLADMPAEFQQAMDRTLNNRPGVFAFIDDVFIVSKGSREEYQKLVRETFRDLEKQGMSLKWKNVFSNRAK